MNWKWKPVQCKSVQCPFAGWPGRCPVSPVSAVCPQWWPHLDSHLHSTALHYTVIGQALHSTLLSLARLYTLPYYPTT